ncbi:MAG: hypothetical protein IAE95_00385, partial [Chitinophagaceae bacterium]|nr:hypothetical protein [Chitinophagaceae bacterium]
MVCRRLRSRSSRSAGCCSLYTPCVQVGNVFCLAISFVHVRVALDVETNLDRVAGVETVDDLVAFTESLRKIPVVVKECPGFLVNRLLMPYLNEATLCLQEGAATAQ